MLHETAIREETEFESNLIQHSSLPTFVIDANHRLLHWNRACEVLTGIPATDILGTDNQWRAFFDHKRPTLVDLVIDGSYDQLPSLYPLFEERTNGFHAEGWRGQMNGKSRYLSFYAAPIYNSKREVIAGIETIEDITERKRTEEALRLLSCAVEQSPHTVMIIDIKGDIEYVNSKFSAMTGFLPEEVIGKNLRFLHADEMSEGHYEAIWESICTGHEWRGESFYKKKNGELYWEATSLSPVRDAAEVITHYVAVKEDRTEQKLAKEKLRQTLSLLNATLESTADGILACDLTGRLLTYNRKFAEMWRLTEQILAMQDEKQLRLSVMDQLKEPGQFMELTDQRYSQPELESNDTLEFKDGRVFERVSRPQIIENEIVGRVISFRDITKRVEAEKALRESAERYRSLVDNIDLGITLIDSAHKIVMTNSAGEKMFNKPAGGLTQKECFREFENRSTKCTHCPGATAMRTGNPAEVQIDWVRDDASRLTVKIKAFPVFGPDGVATGFIEVIQDITDQIKAEKDKKRLEDQLRQSQKFEAIGTLAGGIAHDFNNILTVITGYCSLFERDIPEDSPQREYLSRIFYATEKATNLISGLLAYSRKQPIAPRPVALKEVIQRVSNLLERLLGEDIEFDLQLGDEPLIIMADTLQIEQVLMNLAANARDAMPDGGLLQISVRRQELNTEFLRTQVGENPGPYALLCVSDTGEGMDAETKDRIFEPFFTTKQIGKGTGLGLSIVYGIIKQHHGYININSEPGKGSTFKILLPLTELDQTEIKNSASTRSEGGSETILLVEDDQDIRMSLKKLLEKEGYTVIEAVDGEDGIIKFKEHQGDIQLLLLDVVMPKKNGKEVWEEVRAISPQVKVIFMSGYTADILSAKGALYEGINLIPKPVSINTLSARIREVLDQISEEHL